MTNREEANVAKKKPLGRRVVSGKALILSERILRDKKHTPITKREVIISFKNAAKVIGLSLLDIAIVEALCGCVPPKSFETGSSVIAVVSNRKLIEKIRVPVDKRTVQRSLSRLVNECIIIPSVGADQKRKNQNGVRLGFDLSPLRWRVEEFHRLHQQEKEEAAERVALRKTIGELRNACLQITDHLTQPANQIAEIKRLEATARAAETNEIIMDAMIGLASLKEGLMRQFLEENDDCQDFHRATENPPMDDKNATHQEETYLEKVSLETTGSNDEDAASKCHASKREAKENGNIQPVLTPKEGGSLRITPRALVQAIPELDIFCPEPDRAQWADIDRAADYLSTHIGLNHRAWAGACGSLTRQNAVLILLGVIAKTKSGTVRNPAGLFVRMAQMVANGTVNILSLFNGIAVQKSVEMRTYH